MSQDDEGWEGNGTSTNSIQSRESTVVVDPVSQIPEPMPRFSREPVEKTEVLKGRRIDQLRAEVHRKRKEQRRRQHKRIALWGGAGAGAVLLGALLAGLVFSGPDAVSAAGAASDQEPSSLDEPGSVALDESPSSVPGALRKQGSAAQPSVVEARLVTEESQASAHDDEVADSAAEALEPRQEAATGSLSLDDLPPE